MMRTCSNLRVLAASVKIRYGLARKVTLIDIWNANIYSKNGQAPHGDIAETSKVPLISEESTIKADESSSEFDYWLTEDTSTSNDDINTEPSKIVKTSGIKSQLDKLLSDENVQQVDSREVCGKGRSLTTYASWPNRVVKPKQLGWPSSSRKRANSLMELRFNNRPKTRSLSEENTNCDSSPIETQMIDTNVSNENSIKKKDKKKKQKRLKQKIQKKNKKQVDDSQLQQEPSKEATKELTKKMVDTAVQRSLMPLLPTDHYLGPFENGEGKTYLVGTVVEDKLISKVAKYKPPAHLLCRREARIQPLSFSNRFIICSLAVLYLVFYASFGYLIYARTYGVYPFMKQPEPKFYDNWPYAHLFKLFFDFINKYFMLF